MGHFLLLIKEIVQVLRIIIPYRNVHKRMVIEMFNFVIMMTNAMPIKGEISTTLITYTTKSCINQ